jgi:hypothetical protein
VSFHYSYSVFVFCPGRQNRSDGCVKATMCDDLFSLRLSIHDRLDGEWLLFIDFDLLYYVSFIHISYGVHILDS